VTCPEPVYDAELIAVTPDGPGEFGSDEPYAMVPEAVAAPSPAADARRPCPMCGEMIVATAAKCRFCGEVFDKALLRDGIGAKKGQLRKIASSQRGVQLCVLALVACWIAFGGIQAAVGPSIAPAMIAVRITVAVIWFAALVGLVGYGFLMARHLYSTGIAVLLAIVMLIPCLNLLIALFVSQRATAVLKENGYEVGLLGAKSV
jgi:hypothetical protein